MKLKRFKGNPILKPTKNAWERYVYNAAAIALDNKVHILYRALGRNGVSTIGYASSKDGFHIDERLNKPIFVPKDEFEKPAVKFHNSGTEDPRIVKIGNRLYITYATTNGIIAQVAMASITVKDFLKKRWKWKRHGLLFPDWDNRNAVLFPRKIKNKYVLYHRLKPYIWVSYSSHLKKWSLPKVVMRPRKNMWDDYKIGAAAPPIELEKAWFFIYHCVGRANKKFIYRLGYCLIDKENPEKILCRSKEPILEPKKNYEKRGQVPNVVFSCGAVILGKKLFVYYGGADTTVNVATTNMSSLA